MSVTGVTGIRSNVQAGVKDLLMKMRSLTDKPIGSGFGISGAEQVRQVRDWGADTVIVGTAFVKRLATGTPTQGLQAVEELCQILKRNLPVCGVSSL